MIKIVTYSDTTLTDVAGDINSGTAIDMNCVSIKYDMGAAVQIPQYPGKEVETLAHNTLLAKGDFIGFHNPTIAIMGHIEVNVNTSNLITLLMLQQMVKSGAEMTLTDKYDTAAPDYRISGLTGTYPSETITTLNVVAKSLHVETSSKSAQEGRVLNYTLTLQEVQS